MSGTFSNADAPIVVTEEGSVTDVSAVPMNAPSPIAVNASFSGSFSVSSAVHPANAMEPIAVTVSGRDTSERFSQYANIELEISVIAPKLTEARSAQ